MRAADVKPGVRVVVSERGDLYMEADIRHRIGATGEIARVTKAGLVQIRFDGDAHPDQWSFAARQLDEVDS